MSKRKVTTEDLAAMVQRGFKEMAKKVDMDRGFAAVNERLDRIEKLMLAATSSGCANERARTVTGPTRAADLHAAARSR